MRFLARLSLTTRGVLVSTTLMRNTYPEINELGSHEEIVLGEVRQVSVPKCKSPNPQFCIPNFSITQTNS